MRTLIDLQLKIFLDTSSRTFIKNHILKHKHKSPIRTLPMKLSTILSLAMLSQVAAFAPSSSVNRMNLALQSSTEAVNYVITGNNIEVTDALNEYINKKLDNTVGKLSGTGAIKECDVHLNVNKNPKVSLQRRYVGRVSFMQERTRRTWRSQLGYDR